MLAHEQMPSKAQAKVLSESLADVTGHVQDHDPKRGRREQRGIGEEDKCYDK